MCHVNLTYSYKLWTGWRDRLVDSVVGRTGRPCRSSVHPVESWPRTQTHTLIPGSCRLRAARAPAVRHRSNGSSTDMLIKRPIQQRNSTTASFHPQSAEWNLNPWRSRRSSKARNQNVSPFSLCCTACPAASLWRPTPSLLTSTALLLVSSHQHWIMRLDGAGGVLTSLHLFADSNLKKSEVLRDIQEKSIDLMERREAHLACSCTAQCA